ncbi:MAG: hypothetical protein C0183_21280 [Roseiflexus castenholzii]|uniref:hypothetical protein n=1 Tax=Roseiflexus castenholzii TaxID=120962 RepID=UPI000CC3B043|nr:MAG: hypothetical protein C0183_21280 [Roseiflexus castenholzii]
MESIIALISMAASHLPADLLHLLADPPKFDGLFKALFDWLKNIITVAGGFFLLIDMAKHIFSSPRDLRSAGIDLAVFVILLVVANQSSSIVAWAMGLTG